MTYQSPVICRESIVPDTPEWRAFENLVDAANTLQHFAKKTENTFIATELVGVAIAQLSSQLLSHVTDDMFPTDAELAADSEEIAA